MTSRKAKNMLAVAGLDGCRAGWIAVAMPADAPGAATAVVFLTFADAMAALADCASLVVDMPIGIASEPPGRGVERAMRALLGPRRSSVFEPPLRAALGAATQDEATRLNRAAGGPGISAQSFNIFSRIREIDAWITPEAQDRVRESHPEIAFARRAGAPMAHAKRKPAGRLEREALLAGLGFPIAALGRPRGAAADDLLDACILASVAARVATGEAVRIPEEDPERDARGLRMEIWA